MVFAKLDGLLFVHKRSRRGAAWITIQAWVVLDFGISIKRLVSVLPAAILGRAANKLRLFYFTTAR